MEYAFIRTIDGVYKVPKLESGRYEAYVRPYGFVLDHSDYVDELFNRIVCVVPRGGGRAYKIYSKLQFGKLEMKKLLIDLSKGFVYYGAVWTKTGLKYVAQLTIEGEWKLI